VKPPVHLRPQRLLALCHLCEAAVHFGKPPVHLGETPLHLRPQRLLALCHLRPQGLIGLGHLRPHLCKLAVYPGEAEVHFPHHAGNVLAVPLYRRFQPAEFGCQPLIPLIQETFKVGRKLNLDPLQH
jgi:hypothetical protein